MTKKSLILTGALALSSLSIAGAKTYDITLSSPAKAGNVELGAGEYKVKVEGSNAVFMNVHTAQKFTAPVKIENTGKKHDYTAVESNKQNGTENIKAIELGGSDETLEFGD
jgi:hypothetical protein